MTEELIFINDRNGTRLMEIFFDKTMTIGQLKKMIAPKTKIPELQQRLVLQKQTMPTILDFETKTLEEYNIQKDCEIECRNLGKQILWKTVFYVEYGGPIIISTLLYLLAKQFQTPLEFPQILGYYLFMVHYIKREIETNQVHVFSKQSMPFKNIFKNCFHYWVVAGLGINVELFFLWRNPNYPAFLPYFLAGIFLFFEYLNLNCHITLSQIRRIPGSIAISEEQSKKREIPQGYGFNRISCANYFWEICSWVVFAGIVRCWVAYLFVVISAVQMAIWAIEKHKKYQKEFKDYPKQRKAIIPFLL